MSTPPTPPLVLVVDDESLIREVLALLLADEGYRVLTARDGQEALDHLATHRPDVIVSDIRMPNMHGLAMVERLRADGVATPVVLTSTWAPPPMAGCRFLRKPFDLDEILGVVEETLASGH